MGVAIVIPDCDFSSANLGQVTITSDVSLSSISINGPSYVTGVGVSATYSATYTPIITQDRGVTWSIESGGTYATINSSTGALSILSGANSSTVVIKATSTVDSTIVATKSIVVTYSSSALVIYDGKALMSDGTAYIDGTQYFDGAKRWNTSALYLDVTFKVYEADATNVRSIFGVASSNVSNIDAICLTTGIRMDFGKNGSTYTDSTYVGHLYRAVVDHNAVTVYKDNVVVLNTNVQAGTTNTENGFPLFARLVSGELMQIAANIGIYSAKLTTDADGNVFDVIPCTYYGTPCMYDNISMQVMLPANGGSFIIDD